MLYSLILPSPVLSVNHYCALFFHSAISLTVCPSLPVLYSLILPSHVLSVNHYCALFFPFCHLTYYLSIITVLYSSILPSHLLSVHHYLCSILSPCHPTDCVSIITCALFSHQTWGTSAHHFHIQSHLFLQANTAHYSILFLWLVLLFTTICLCNKDS